MKFLRAEDIHCKKCVERIHNALSGADIKHQVDLLSKTVSIDGDDDCLATAKELMEDLGFETVQL